MLRLACIKELTKVNETRIVCQNCVCEEAVSAYPNGEKDDFMCVLAVVTLSGCNLTINKKSYVTHYNITHYLPVKASQNQSS